MSYTNLNNPANYQLQSFGQDGMRTVSTTQAYVEGEYYRVIVAVEDSTISATSMVGDNLTNIDVYAGTTIYGLFTAITVSVGEVTAYLAGRTDIDDVWAYIKAYGLSNGATIEAEQCAKDAISPLLDKYYAQASLVLVPSLYKTSVVYAERPLDANGQLTFTRASGATRVGPDGLIQKVRTNLALQSNTFSNAPWLRLGPSTPTVTSGQADKDGGTEAWLVSWSATQSTSYIYQSISTISTPHTASCWMKGTAGEKILFGFGVNVGQGVEVTFTGNWQRISHTSSSGTLVFFSNFIAGNASSFYVQYCQSEAGDIATDYIPTTTTAVSVGPVNNLPRLNYPINADGSVGCPSLLLEPQRTNLALFSEAFSNWVSENTNTISSNAAVSPDGYTNANKLVTSTSSERQARRNNLTTSGNIAMSVFAKAGEYGVIQFTDARNGDYFVNFDLVNGVVGSSNTMVGTIESYSNGWYRCSATYNSVSDIISFRISIAQSATSARLLEFAGNGTDGLYLWGAQLEAGNYATSYIPTLSTSVTRVADAAYKTGISSLIGQTEGTLFGHLVFDSAEPTNRILSITGTNWSDSSLRFDIISNQGQGTIRSAGVDIAKIYATGTISKGDEVKFALVYTASSVKLFINGALRGSATPSASLPSTSELHIDALGGGFSSTLQNNQLNPYKQALVFKTALTDAQAIELTTL